MGCSCWSSQHPNPLVMLPRMATMGRRLMDLHREVERWDFFVLLDGAAQEFSLVIGDDVGEGVEKLSYFHLDGGDDFGGFCGFDASVGLGL